MDSISRIELFLEVAKYQSFAQAARQLGMTGPALSKQVQKLEEELGVRLLQRTTRHVSLTEEGAFYSKRARKALEDLLEAQRQLQELKECPTGALRVSTPMSFGQRYLTGPIAEFAHQYPEVKLDVDFDDRRVDIIEEGYDVAIRIGKPEDSSLIMRKLADCPIILCASPEYAHKHGLPQSPEQLIQHPMITYSKHGLNHQWRYRDDQDHVDSVSLNNVFSANNAEMMLQACRKGIGLTLLPIFVAIDLLESKELIHVLPCFQTYPKSSIYVLFPQNRYLSTRVRLFVECLQNHAKSFPWT